MLHVMTSHATGRSWLGPLLTYGLGDD